VFALIGYFAARNLNDVPAWYLLALVVTAIPCSWAGGVVQQWMLMRH
jgi:hypothetical protein